MNFRCYPGEGRGLGLIVTLVVPVARAVLDPGLRRGDGLEEPS